KNIFCYYSSFAQTRHSVGNFLPENINPFLCTHIIYAFVDITPDGRDLQPFNRNDHGPNGLYSRTLALKLKNPALKVLLAVGGWQIGSKPFIPMIRDETTRTTWINNVVSYVRRHGFDGFDVDWEFPATRGSPPQDKYRFTLLMKGLYEAFAEEAKESGKDKLLLTLATASGTYYIDQSYEPSKIINYIDFMLLMTYNYHGQWEKVTGHHSGLHAHKDDPKTGEKAQLYQEWSIDYWLDVGIPKEKLIVGLPTYGMSFTLAGESENGVHAPAVGGGRMGDYTRETGILAYYEICLNLKDKGWEAEWIDEQAVPYSYGGDQWAGYEDKKSIAIKAKNILKRNLAGAFVWSLEMDDFGGVCGQGQYPLISTIVEIIGGGAPNQPAARQAANHYRPRKEPAYKESAQTSEQQTSSEESELITEDLEFPIEKIKGELITSKKGETTTATTTVILSTIKPSSDDDSTVRQDRWWGRQIGIRARHIQRRTLKPETASTRHYFFHHHRHSVKPDTDATPSNTRRNKPARTSVTSSKHNQPAAPASKMAHEFASNEVHEVKSWQTTPWWSGASKSLKVEDDHDYLSARATGRPGLGLQKEPTPGPLPAVEQTTTEQTITEGAQEEDSLSKTAGE
ncbi:unnamed protein product, partial [Lymnaea stagnalis]